MMALNDGRVAHTALDDVRVDRALHEIIHPTELFRFRLKHADEFFSDNLALALRLLHACELQEKALRRVNTNQIHIELLAEHPLDIVPFPLAEQAVVDEYAGQILADRLVQQHGGHRRIHAARKGAQHLFAL